MTKTNVQVKLSQYTRDTQNFGQIWPAVNEFIKNNANRCANKPRQMTGEHDGSF